MSKRPPRHGKKWTQKNVKRLCKLADQKASTKSIAKELGRSAFAVRSKASRIGVRLGYVPARPPVRSPRKSKGNK